MYIYTSNIDNIIQKVSYFI